MARKSRYESNSVKPKYNIALYVRLSEEDEKKEKKQDESSSVKAQKTMLELYAKNLDDVNLYKFYVDDGYTGGNFERPAFQTMMNDVLDKKINCIIVKDFSRFGRDYREVAKYLQVMFPTLNVRFISLNDNYDSEVNADEIDILLMGFAQLMNEEYLKDCSVKAKLSYSIRQEQGKFTAPVAPYGYKRSEYDIHKLVVDDMVKEVVKFIYKDFLEKKSYTAVAQDLMNRRILSPSEYKQIHSPYWFTNRLTNKRYVWSRDTVTTILKSVFYIGHTAQHRREKVNYKTNKWNKLPPEQWVIVENTHEPIIDLETFNQVQEIINNRKKTCFIRKHKTNRSKENIFSGLLYCGDCNSKMSFVDDKNRKYTFYKCKLKSLNTKMCNQTFIKTKELENTVFNIVKTYIKLACDMDKTIKELEKFEKQQKQKGINSKTFDLVKINADHEMMKEVLYERYRSGDFTLTEYKAKKAEMEERFERLKLNAQIYTMNFENSIHNEFIENFKKHKNIKKLTCDIAHTLINKIIVHSCDNIEIEFNFKDEFEEAFKFVNDNKNKLNY